MFDNIDQLGVNSIRTLSMDMIFKAKSGHPGLPMGAAPMAYVLWNKFLKLNPTTSTSWCDRDRFILSAGHGSAMLYSLLHLSGFDVSLEDLKHFRQLNSKTPGHPEVHHTDGVEVTTGPLGQGLAMGVGMAMAEAHLSAQFNREHYKMVDHYTYVLCGDGDLMEGISHEVSSLAGHLKLNKLIVLYDSNKISLDGPTDKAFTEDVQKRFEAYGWETSTVRDGNNLDEIYSAIENAKASDRPSLIEIRTVIGYGSKNQGTSSVHGAPLSEEDMIETKRNYNWNYPDFTVPKEVYKRFSEIKERGQKEENNWNKLFEEYTKRYPVLAQKLKSALKDEYNMDWVDNVPVYEIGTKIATRNVSKTIIQELAKVNSQIWGGSADLSSSNNTHINENSDFAANNYAGRNIWFGVREFGMAAAMNGIQIHGGSRVFGSTFFAFVDYFRPALRLAALQHTPTIFVLTHDSIALGEDGPTHQPVEQLSSLRSIPNVQVIRPADAYETIFAWKKAIETLDKPTVLVLTRQAVPVLKETVALAENNVQKGGYVISKSEKDVADGILIATGSEVSLALSAKEELKNSNIDVSVVSIPSVNLFEEQSDEYKESVLPHNIQNRVLIEAGTSYGWGKYANAFVTIDQFGKSGRGNEVMNEFGFTVESIVKKFKENLNK